MDQFALLVPLAIGLAISPAPLIELILVLFSQRRVVNSVVFVVSLAVSSTVLLFLGALASDRADAADDGSSTPTNWILLAFGAVMLIVAVVNLRNRHDRSEPAVFAKVTGMGPIAVAVLSLGATAFNPKNLPLLLGAGSAIAATSRPLLFGVGFLVLALAPYWAAALYAGLGGAPAHARLDRLRAWLIAHNRWVMGIISLILGLVLVLKAATALA